LLKQGVVREREGDYVGALRRYSNGRTAAQALPKGNEQTRHMVRLGLATAGVRLRQGKLAECIRWCRDEVVPTALAIQDLESVAHAYYLLHLSYTSLGWAERRDFRGIALPIYEELGDLLGQANVLNNLGIDAYYEGRWEDALDHYEQSRRLRERIGDVVGAATIVGNIAEILSDQRLRCSAARAHASSSTSPPEISAGWPRERGASTTPSRRSKPRSTDSVS
jgi:tetratricopeptide (TPR) repeat protein